MTTHAHLSRDYSQSYLNNFKPNQEYTNAHRKGPIQVDKFPLLISSKSYQPRYSRYKFEIYPLYPICFWLVKIPIPQYPTYKTQGGTNPRSLPAFNWLQMKPGVFELGSQMIELRRELGSEFSNLDRRWSNLGENLGRSFRTRDRRWSSLKIPANPDHVFVPGFTAQ